MPMSAPGDASPSCSRSVGTSCAGVFVHGGTANTNGTVWCGSNQPTLKAPEPSCIENDPLRMLMRDPWTASPPLCVGNAGGIVTTRIPRCGLSVGIIESPQYEATLPLPPTVPYPPVIEKSSLSSTA